MHRDQDYQSTRRYHHWCGFLPRHPITKPHLHVFFVASGDYRQILLVGTRTSNPKGNTLHRYMQRKSLDCHFTGEPTLWLSDPLKPAGHAGLRNLQDNKRQLRSSAVSMLLNIPDLNPDPPLSP